MMCFTPRDPPLPGDDLQSSGTYTIIMVNAESVFSQRPDVEILESGPLAKSQRGKGLASPDLAGTGDIILRYFTDFTPPLCFHILPWTSVTRNRLLGIWDLAFGIWHPARPTSMASRFVRMTSYRITNCSRLVSTSASCQSWRSALPIEVHVDLPCRSVMILAHQ